MEKLIIGRLEVKNKLFKLVLFKRDKELLFENRNLYELFKRGEYPFLHPYGALQEKQNV